MEPPEPWIERVIREAAEAGEFDDLAGSGRPIADLQRQYEPGWWAERWLARERRADAAHELKAQRRRLFGSMLAAETASEAKVRAERFNRSVAEHNTVADDDRVAPVDVADLVARWRRAKAGTASF